MQVLIFAILARSIKSLIPTNYLKFIQNLSKVIIIGFLITYCFKLELHEGKHGKMLGGGASK